MLGVGSEIEEGQSRDGGGKLTGPLRAKLEPGTKFKSGWQSSDKKKWSAKMMKIIYQKRHFVASKSIKTQKMANKVLDLGVLIV